MQKMKPTLKPRRRASARFGSALTCALLLLVSSGTPSIAQKKPAPSKASPPAPAARAPVPADVLLRIVRAEDERRWEESGLGALFDDKSAAVRRRAALAAGRIGDVGAITRLSSLLRADPDEDVRASAAFAIGEIEAESGADALLEALRLSRTPDARARSIEALGKIAAALPEARADAKKRIGEAITSALAAERTSPHPNYTLELLGLTAMLRAKPENGARTVALFLNSVDARARADAANTLARLRAKEGLERLRAMLDKEPDAVARANAARALGAAEDGAAFDALLARANSDTDARVRVSAIRSLALLKDARAAAPLIKRAGELSVLSTAAANKSAGAPASEQNELLEIATALGRLRANTNDARALALLRYLRGARGAPEVEIALARVAPAQYVGDVTGVMRAAGGKKLIWQQYSAYGQGLGELAALASAPEGAGFVALQPDAQKALREMLSDAGAPALAVPDLLRALAAFRPSDLAALMRAQLKADDVIVRATAAELLGEAPPDAATSRALVEALPRALRDELNDAALSLLGALAKQKEPEAQAALRSALEAQDYLVRRRAAELLRAAGAAPPSAGTVATRNREADYRRALARVGKSVLAVVQTDKGAFTIELLPDDAPLNVDNFVELARKNFFNGITFHRVVPNFVIQGGDPRGDGNGGPGYQIRCEINEVPYGRGAVGMALSGKDTGGSQWFVTHSPQPHLDGGYTVFGRVVEGMDVVDRIARGDRIRSIKITEGRTATKRRR